jgi:hypothetical protein
MPRKKIKMLSAALLQSKQTKQTLPPAKVAPNSAAGLRPPSQLPRRPRPVRTGHTAAALSPRRGRAPQPGPPLLPWPPSPSAGARSSGRRPHAAPAKFARGRTRRPRRCGRRLGYVLGRRLQRSRRALPEDCSAPTPK